MSALTYPLALSAAAVFAVATAMEHRSATDLPGARGLTPRQIGSLVAVTVRHPWWLGGMLVNTIGLGLHALALHSGALAVVQPLLVTTVLFALPVNQVLRREPISPAQLGWAVALVIGLTGFLLIATAGAPAGDHTADTWPAVAAAVLAVVLVGSLAATARRTGRGVAAALLGAAAGIAFAVTAALLKACATLLTHGPLRLAGSWQLYALLIAGVAGLLLSQLAFQAGPLAASLPAITVANPLVAVGLGVVVYDENLRHTPPALIAEAVSLALIALAATALTRRVHTDRSHR